MADSIVQGLFGVDPYQYQQQQAAYQDTQAQNFAGMTGAQQGQYGMFRGGQMAGGAIAGMMGGQDPMLAKATDLKRIISQYDTTTPEGLKQAAQALAQAGHPEQAQMAITHAQKLEAGQQDNQYTGMKIKGLQSSQEMEVKMREALSKLTPEQLADPKEVVKAITPFADSKTIMQVSAQMAEKDAALKMRQALAGAGGGGLGKLSPAEKAVDLKFGKDYNEFFAGGGINNLEKNLGELGRAIKIIEQSKDGDTSGKMIGLLDKTGMLSYAAPEAADAKDLIGGVAQSNLRQILGGQFAQKEGEQLLQRQYDTAQNKEANLKRLRALYKQAAETIADKKQAAMYYEANGTLKGYKGTSGGSSSPSESSSTPLFASNGKERIVSMDGGKTWSPVK